VRLPKENHYGVAQNLAYHPEARLLQNTRIITLEIKHHILEEFYILLLLSAYPIPGSHAAASAPVKGTDDYCST
jgi:hypothetical protein